MENTDISSAPQTAAQKNRAEGFSLKPVEGLKQKGSVTANVQKDLAYAFWRNFANFPLFMKRIHKVEVVSPIVSHWVVEMKNAPNIEWDAEIIAEKTDEMIAWRSIGNSLVKQAGSVWFMRGPTAGETVITLNMNYEVPGGKLTELAGKLIGDDPKTMILNDLRHFKDYIEVCDVLKASMH